MFSTRGIVASILVFLCFGVTQAKDGPFTRPHPGNTTSSRSANTLHISASSCCCTSVNTSLPSLLIRRLSALTWDTLSAKLHPVQRDTVSESTWSFLHFERKKRDLMLLWNWKPIIFFPDMACGESLLSKVVVLQHCGHVKHKKLSTAVASTGVNQTL